MKLENESEPFFFFFLAFCRVGQKGHFWLVF